MADAWLNLFFVLIIHIKTVKFFGIYAIFKVTFKYQKAMVGLQCCHCKNNFCHRQCLEFVF